MIRPKLTLLQAIDEAGGFTDYAEQKSVKVKLAANNSTRVCDVTKIISNPNLDEILRAGDQISVAVRQ